MAAEDGVRALAQLGCGGERPEGRGCQGQACGRLAGARITKEKLGVLVIRASRASGHVDLVIVVFPGTLELEPELQRMAALNPRETIREGIDWPRRVRRIRSAVQRGEAGHGCGWYAGRNQLPLRKDIWIVQTHGGAVQEVRLIHGDVDIIQAESGQRLLDQGGPNCPYLIDPFA